MTTPPPSGTPEPGPWQQHPGATQPGAAPGPAPYPPPPPGGAFPPGPGTVPGPGGPAPYGALPGYPQGHGPSWAVPPPPRPPMNGLAVASLATLPTCLAPVSLILGIVALVQIRRHGQRGKGMAVAGVAVSSAMLLLIGLGITAAILSDEQGVDELRAGDCFNTSAEPGGTEYAVEVIPCDQPHNAEAYGEARSGYSGDYPGAELLELEAARECAARLQPYVLDVWELSDGLWPSYYYPRRDSWEDFGDRRFLCFLHSGDGPLEHSLRADASGFTPEQLRFLELSGPLTAALISEPPQEAELEDFTGWADEMTRLSRQQSDRLEEAPWETEGVAALAATLAEARRSGAEHWEQAAAATGWDVFQQHYDSGYAAFGHQEEIALREALELATGATPAGPGLDA
ncbi:Septum formation [Streptomyces aidingensis]|uniref:Septum formation n=1 Tax=Streptomyces aidingensis TaxID=910347 RepID=A0A1I1LJ12_9ACTN|nr:Septum formation [Streptomyces aidingensis]